MKGKVYLIGIGSGNAQDITPRAVKIIKEAQVIIGHRNSLDSLKGLNPGGQMIDCPMSPLERSAAAVEAARGGSTVAIVSSGDPGIYAIGSTFFNYLQQQGLDLDVEVVPGITAASDAASLLGAPLGNDFAVVSLADQAGDWQTALQRIVAAAQADFVLVIYNPLGKIGLTRLGKYARR
jgi:precorrin-3B C17-methyltransferase